jgi:hypothetical protein
VCVKKVQILLLGVELYIYFYTGEVALIFLCRTRLSECVSNTELKKLSAVGGDWCVRIFFPPKKKNATQNHPHRSQTSSNLQRLQNRK